jgi:hypothetical protein
VVAQDLQAGRGLALILEDDALLLHLPQKGHVGADGVFLRRAR